MILGLLLSLTGCGHGVHAQALTGLDYGATGQGWHETFTDPTSCTDAPSGGGVLIDNVKHRFVAVAQGPAAPLACGDHAYVTFAKQGERPSWWPASIKAFCIDQIYLQDKVPVTWRPSYLYMDYISVRSGSGVVAIGPACYNSTDWPVFPAMIYGNNWTENENVRVTFAGEIR